MLFSVLAVSRHTLARDISSVPISLLFFPLPVFWASYAPVGGSPEFLQVHSVMVYGLLMIEHPFASGHSGVDHTPLSCFLAGSSRASLQSIV